MLVVVRVLYVHKIQCVLVAMDVNPWELEPHPLDAPGRLLTVPSRIPFHDIQTNITHYESCARRELSPQCNMDSCQWRAVH